MVGLRLQPWESSPYEVMAIVIVSQITQWDTPKPHTHTPATVERVVFNSVCGLLEGRWPRTQGLEYVTERMVQEEPLREQKRLYIPPLLTNHCESSCSWGQWVHCYTVQQYIHKMCNFNALDNASAKCTNSNVKFCAALLENNWFEQVI